MPKQTSKTPAVKKGEMANSKKAAKPKAKNKKKSAAKPQASTKSTVASSSVAESSTSHSSIEPSSTKLVVGSTSSVVNSGSRTSYEASPNTSSTSIETLSSAASHEETVIAKKSPVQNESDSEISEATTETASEKSGTTTETASEKSEPTTETASEKSGATTETASESSEPTTETASEKSDTITDTASEKSKTDSNSAFSSKIISQSPQPLSMLENKWTLWYYVPRKGLAWEECQERVYSFNTVEHFWSMLNHLTRPSELPAIADLALFKKDYRPMWEDPINKNGGRWLITLNRHRQKDVEAVWREALIFLVGEYYKYSDSVCGIVLSHRNYCDKIAIWTSNRFEHEVMSIGQSAKRNMLLDFSPEMVFESHVQTQLNASTFGKGSTKTLYKI